MSRNGLCTIASTNCPETFRTWRRKDALYISRAHYCSYQALPKVQEQGASGKTLCTRQYQPLTIHRRKSGKARFRRFSNSSANLSPFWPPPSKHLPSPCASSSWRLKSPTNAASKTSRMTSTCRLSPYTRRAFQKAARSYKPSRSS